MRGIEWTHDDVRYRANISNIIIRQHQVKNDLKTDLARQRLVVIGLTCLSSTLQAKIIWRVSVLITHNKKTGYSNLVGDLSVVPLDQIGLN